MKYLLPLLVVPLFAQQVATVRSAEKERALGQHCAGEIRKQAKPYGIPAVDAYVTRVGNKLVNYLNDPSREYRFQVISGGNWTEPFAIPGGDVFVPVRALAVAQDEAEFVHMLADAIGHLELGHGISTVAQGAGNTASIPLVFMSACEGVHANAGAPQMLIPLAVRQSQQTYELEADAFARQLTAEAGGSREDFQSAQQLARSSIEQQPPRRVPTLRR